MNKRVWKQTDSRWASKPYPVARRSTVGGCGCGLLACTHVAMEQSRYKNITPEYLRPWMVKQGFAEVGNGTKWEGITQTLKHIGHKEVVRIYNDPMSAAFKELAKGNRIGIILFHGGRAPNGVRWTTGGHYIAFTDYKVQKGLHYFYCKDSGGRNHTGWYSYENSMRGCISKVWIVKRIAEPKKAEPKKVTKTNAQKINEKALELAWPAGTSESKYKKKGGKPTSAFVKAWKKHFPGDKVNTGCHSAVRLVLRETIDPKAMPSLDWSKILKYFRTSGKYTELKVNFTQAQLKAGDIRIHQNSSGGWHIWIICNNGKWLRFEANQGSSNDRYAHLTRSTAGNQKKHKKDFLFRVR